jgi:uncharacterized protein involved in outer membrane biogenesis
MKKTLVILAGLAVVAVALFFVFSNPVGRLVKLVVEKFGPEMTQATVRVSSVNISTEGKGALHGMLLGNPKGFKTDFALKADNVEVAIEPASIAQDVVVIHKILIDGPHIIYEKNDSGTNFDAIQRNVERYLGVDGGKAKKDDKSDKGESKKMIIDSFVIRNAKVNYNGMMDLSLPDIELRNIGRKTGGATSAQVVKAIIAELNAKLVLALAKAAAINAVGGPAIGIGMGIKSLLEK